MGKGRTREAEMVWDKWGSNQVECWLQSRFDCQLSLPQMP